MTLMLQCTCSSCGSLFCKRCAPSRVSNIEVSHVCESCYQKPDDMSVVTDEVKKNWRMLIRGYQFAKTDEEMKEFRTLARKGVPKKLRGFVWPWIVNAQEYQIPGLYQDLVVKAKTESEFLVQIELDVQRTFPEHILFADEVGQRRLSNILSAYSVFNPKVGYHQGLNFFVGVLMMHMDEESAFWTFVQLAKTRHSLAGFFWQ